MTEKKLIRDCQKGIKSSQFLLVKKYSGMLLTVCRRYARDEAMAKDVLQESFIKIFQNIGKYKPIGSFEAWMRRIAVRRSLQWLEKSHFKHEIHAEIMPDEEMIIPKIHAQLGAEDILKLLNELPTGFRTVFNLFVVEGFSHKEIGEILNITENTSRSQLTRARKVLQKKLLNTQKKMSDRPFGLSEVRSQTI